MMKIKRQNKLRTYLAVTAGVGCAASVAEGAVVFYGVNGPNDTNEDPDDLNFGFGTVSLSGNAGFYRAPQDEFFTRDGATAMSFSGSSNVVYGAYVDVSSEFGVPMGSFYGFELMSGAVVGNQNFALVSFTFDTGPLAVAQFDFSNFTDSGFLVALAFAEGTTLSDGITPLTNANAPSDLSTLTNTSFLSISEGVALIEAAAVPEPSSLVLLALGATGLAARRKRKMAA